MYVCKCTYGSYDVTDLMGLRPHVALMPTLCVCVCHSDGGAADYDDQGLGLIRFRAIGLWVIGVRV